MLDRDLHVPSALVLAAEAIALRNVRLRSFLLRLLDPEDLGHAVSHEVRQEALRLLLPPKHTSLGQDRQEESKT